MLVIMFIYYSAPNTDFSLTYVDYFYIYKGKVILIEKKL